MLCLKKQNVNKIKSTPPLKTSLHWKKNKSKVSLNEEMEGNSQARVSPSIIHERLLICTHGHEGCWGGILAGGMTKSLDTEGWDCIGEELNKTQNPKTTQPSQEKGQRRHVPTSISVLYGRMWDPPANSWACCLVCVPHVGSTNLHVKN